MGLFDNVTLSDAVLEMAREQYRGDKEIRFDGWQTKSLDCQLHKIKLTTQRIWRDKDVLPTFTGEIRFYQMSSKLNDAPSEWLEFVAVYVDGVLAAIRHIPESK